MLPPWPCSGGLITLIFWRNAVYFRLSSSQHFSASRELNSVEWVTIADAKQIS